MKKEAVKTVAQGHPWIFRKHMSTACDIFADGQWLALYDGQNNICGYGIYEAEGAIAIRVLKQGANPPDLNWFRSKVLEALGKRQALRQRVTGFRAINGESDGLPGIVIDIYGAAGVLQTYSSGSDALGRYAAGLVFSELKLKSMLSRVPKRRFGNKERGLKLLRGNLIESSGFSEEGLKLSADLRCGQKSGVFLDLRGLRRWIRQQDLKGLRVLNLFCYSGTLGLCAELAGAREIWQADASEAALELAQRCHTVKQERHKFICADIFSWIYELPATERFDLIIVDTPSLTTKTQQLEYVLRRLQKFYAEVSAHLAPGGRLVACDCTSRISRDIFRSMLDGALLNKKLGLGHALSLSPETDHAPSFPEADYLKVEIYASMERKQPIGSKGSLSQSKRSNGPKSRYQ
ncbi:MAG: class I SAM-dependent methyltransferase [bacterium]|nr:class I SAM-dependent methyltransferase [bacterium]